MANLLALKRRIRTAQNVSKTTKAMQMIAASKLKKAQDAALSARPYVEKLTSISQNISNKVDPDNLNDYMKYLTDKNEKLMLVVAPDKGLCGGLVTNLGRELYNFSKENKNTKCIAVGKKANGIIRAVGGEIIASFEITTTLPPYDLVYPVMKIIDEHFLAKNVSEVYILNSNFNSIFSQSPAVKKLLPAKFEAAAQQQETIFEPNAEALLPGLIRHYLELSVYQAFLENYLSEQAARMLAMQNATNNAKDIIEDLRLLYNKSRQEKITNEILDISGGVFAAYA
jgi:F-type H+-transporting ATPase subunit gamma